MKKYISFVNMLNKYSDILDLKLNCFQEIENMIESNVINVTDEIFHERPFKFKDNGLYYYNLYNDNNGDVKSTHFIVYNSNKPFIVWSSSRNGIANVKVVENEDPSEIFKAIKNNNYVYKNKYNIPELALFRASYTSLIFNYLFACQYILDQQNFDKLSNATDFLNNWLLRSSIKSNSALEVFKIKFNNQANKCKKNYLSALIGIDNNSFFDYFMSSRNSHVFNTFYSLQLLSHDCYKNKQIINEIKTFENNFVYNSITKSLFNELVIYVENYNKQIAREYPQDISLENYRRLFDKEETEDFKYNVIIPIESENFI